MSREKGKLLQCHPLQQRVEISALGNFGHSSEAVRLVTTCINWERACVEVEEGSCSADVRATRLTCVYAQESEYTSGYSATTSPPFFLESGQGWMDYPKKTVDVWHQGGNYLS